MQTSTGETEEESYNMHARHGLVAGLQQASGFKPPSYTLFGLIASHLLIEPELQAQQILFTKAF